MSKFKTGHSSGTGQAGRIRLAGGKKGPEVEKDGGRNCTDPTRVQKGTK